MSAHVITSEDMSATEGDRPKRLHWKLRIALAAAGLVTAFGVCLGVWRVMSVAAVQQALERDWEIKFNAGGRPYLLPERLDAAAESFIRRRLGPQRDPLFLGEKPNRVEVWQERFRSLFRGRITEVEIYYPGRLRGDLGRALERFPSLERLKIHKADFSQPDLAYVFAGVQNLRRLETLEIGGDGLDDAAIEPLAGQRSVRAVAITTGKMGAECVHTFARLSRLMELSFGVNAIDDGHEPNEPPLPETQKVIRDALPKVKVGFL